MTTIKNKSNATYTVEKHSELLPFLIEILHPKSRTAVKGILKRGQVSVDGKSITQHNHPLRPGQKIEILSNQTARKLSALYGLSIVHEDKDIIVINKDAGILSMGFNNPNEPNAYRQLTDYVRANNPKNRIYIVHRLDRDTSGVMIYAKTEDAKLQLQNNWHNVVKNRTYTALVEGNVTDEKGKVESWLSENKAMRVYSTDYDNGGKHAVTHYRKLSGNDEYSLLEVELKTGRKNQIRVHMQDIGHPVAGDKKYGARTNPLKRLSLHATTLTFTHPGTGELVSYSVKAPQGFKRLGR